MSLIKSILKKLLLSLATLALLLVLGEVTARAIEPGPFTLYDANPYVEHPADPRVVRHRANFRGRWDGTWYETNSMGLRGPRLELTYAPTEFRVVAVGDSCTFGKGVLEEHCWPRQLERTLGTALGREWRAVVANLGVNGYSGATYERIFREIGVGLKPDVVVVGYNLNDFPNAIRAVDELVFRERKARKLLSQELRDFLGRFAAYRWARQTYYHMSREEDWQDAEAFARGAGEDGEDSAVWLQQEEYLRAIRDEAREIGAETAVFLFPYESQVYLDAYDATPIERLRRTCEKLDVPMVDLAEEFRAAARASDPPRQLFLKGDRYHPNPDGYHLVARAVLELLRGEGWLPKKDDSF